MEDLVIAEYLATCHTEGCENEDIELRVYAPAENPHIVCGPCFQTIEDIALLTQ